MELKHRLKNHFKSKNNRSAEQDERKVSTLPMDKTNIADSHLRGGAVWIRAAWPD